jgi:hypothetical protein
MLEQLERTPATARASLLAYLNDPARSVAELDCVFGSILGERLARAIIGAAPFETLVDLHGRVSGVDEDKLMNMITVQLEGRVPGSRPTRTTASPQAHPRPADGVREPDAAHRAPTTGPATSFGFSCFAPVGAPCFATSPASWPPSSQPSSRDSAPNGVENDSHASTTQRADMPQTSPQTPSFEDAYRARLAQIQNYWKAVDIEALDLTMMHPSSFVAGCFGTAGTFGTIGTSGGCLGSVGTMMTFGSASPATEPRIATGGLAYGMNPYAMSYTQTLAPSVLAGTAGTFGTAGTAGCVGGTIGSMATIGTRGCWG